MLESHENVATAQANTWLKKDVYIYKQRTNDSTCALSCIHHALVYKTKLN